MLWRSHTNQPCHLCSLIIYQVLHPSSKPIHTDPDKHYLTKTTEWTLGLIPDKVTDLFSLIELLPKLVSCPPRLCTLSRNKVLKVISQLWLDCFTGVAQTVTTVILIKITCMYLIYRCWQFHRPFLKIYMLPLLKTAQVINLIHIWMQRNNSSVTDNTSSRHHDLLF